MGLTRRGWVGGEGSSKFKICRNWKHNTAGGAKITQKLFMGLNNPETVIRTS